MSVADGIAFFGSRTLTDIAAFSADGAAVSVGAVDGRARALAERVGEAPALVSLVGDRLSVVISLLAALYTDRPCLMPHDHAEETVRRLVRDYPKACFVMDDERFPAVTSVRIDHLDVLPPASWAPDFPGDRLAARVFTSGSTGTPAIYDKPWAALAAVGSNLATRLPFTAGLRVVATVPGQHMYGLEASLMLPLRGGGPLHARRPLFPADVAADLVSDGAAALVTTPVHLRALLRSAQAASSPRFVLSATAPLDRALATKVEERLGAPVYEIFGCTEAGTVATRRTARDVVWRPCKDIVVRATGTGTAEVTAAYLPQSVRLADRVRVRGDGWFTLTGREGDLLNIAGKRGSLADITRRLMALPGVEDAAVHLPEDGDSGEVKRLAAFVVAPGLTAAEIRASLRELLDPAFMPRPLVCLSALPRNAAGKVTRATLERLYAAHAGGHG